MQTLARGALAGLAATVPMTAVIGAGRAAGLMGTPPPVEITENVAEQAGEDPDRQSPEFQAAWLAAHAGIRRRLRGGLLRDPPGAAAL